MLALFFPAPFTSLAHNWKLAWRGRPFRIRLSLVAVLLLVIVALIPAFFRYVQATPGFAPGDPLLQMIPATDWSLVIFMLIYAVILLGCLNLATNPLLLLDLLLAYLLMTLARMLCMYLVPLEPPEHLIPLEDPFIGHFFYKGETITKDLFFSGHVSTMSLLIFFTPFRQLKALFILATVFVALFLLWQHVHYTIDLMAAPLIAWLCYRLAVSPAFVNTIRPGR